MIMKAQTNFVAIANRVGKSEDEIKSFYFKTTAFLAQHTSLEDRLIPTVALNEVISHYGLEGVAFEFARES